MNVSSTDFSRMVTGFLTDYLPLQRNYSRNTILSYRDTLRLFIRYLADEMMVNINRFTLKDFNRATVIGFLEWYRKNGASPSAANQRLAALKAFAQYAQLENVELLAPLMEISGVKSKKAPERDISYLTAEQMKKLINFPTVNTPTEFRHRIAMTLLYDSGCRVQELCDITISDVFLGTNSTVKLHGKGAKTRTVIISDESGKLLRTFIDRYHRNSKGDTPLIFNRFGHKMDRDGIGYVIDKYVNRIRVNDPSFPSKVHCHMFRHSKAMHMLEAGINIVYIRDFLGHEDVSTTMIYLRSDNRLKDDAINKLAPKIAGDVTLPDWNRNPDLMAFLNSLK